MRQIKFRAWDGTKMLLMHEICTSTGLEGGLCSFEMLMESISDMPLMQFTGLKDRHGKEIYEGDILQKESDKYLGTDLDRSVNMMTKEKTIDKVVYKGSCFSAFNNILHRCYNIEIIGNIYEHEYLLHENKNGK